MTIPTSNELDLLRSQPHRTQLYLSIYKPNTVLSAKVNDGDAAKGDRVITYDGASGTWQNIKRGMTLYVGTSVGAKDKGSVYVKEATASTITVGENSHINWADDDDLTVVDFFQIWPLYPRYTQDDINITVYKDYDVVYTDQNEILGSIMCMGPHHAGFLDGGSHDVYFTASGTSHVGGDTLSYHWLFPGADTTGSSVHTPGNIAYSSAGHYTASLTVSGSSTGAVDISHRHVSIYDRPEEGTNVPILNWGLNLLTGDRGAGGYTARIWMRENISDVEDGALVVIFSDDWYGTTQQSIGGNALNRSNIFYVGYILDGTIDFDYQTSVATFDVGSPTEMMKLTEAFSVSVQDSTNPSADATSKGGDPWFYLVNLSMETALYHYMRWHSTINLCNDVEYIATDFLLQFFDADRSSLFDALNTVMLSAVDGKALCDRQGKLFFEIEPEAIPSALTAIPTSLNMTKADWINQPSIVERTSGELSSLEVGGVKWDGAAADTYTPLLIVAPGEVPAYRGSSVRLSGYAFSSLAQAKALAGNMYANRNSQFPVVSLNITGNYRNFDIVPSEAAKLSLVATDTFREIVWTEKPFSVNRVEWLYNSKQNFLRPNITVAEITEGFDADDLEIPEIPPTDGFDQPPLIVPPLPTWPTPIGVGGVGGGDQSFVQAVYGYDAYNGVDLLRSTSVNREGLLIFSNSSTVDSIAYGFSGVNNAGTITAYMVFRYAALSSATAVLRNSVRYGACGALSSRENSGDLEIGIPSTGGSTTYHVGCFNPISFIVSPGDQLFFEGERDSTYAADTAAFLYFAGWYLIYT